jgi:DnaJ-class molecular chaperone
MNNQYRVLGVTPSTPLKEIKHRYRQLAQKCHPDKQGSADEFTKLKAAYDYVVNDIKINRDTASMLTRNPNSRVIVSIDITEGILGCTKYISTSERIVEITVPPGTLQSVNYVISGAGRKIVNNLPAGDLHVTININNDTQWRVTGNSSLVTEVDVLAFDAILETMQTVRLPDGSVTSIKLTDQTPLELTAHNLPVTLYVVARIVQPRLTAIQKQQLSNLIQTW